MFKSSKQNFNLEMTTVDLYVFTLFSHYGPRNDSPELLTKPLKLIPTSLCLFDCTIHNFVCKFCLNSVR